MISRELTAALQARALAIVNGNGEARSKGQIVAEVERALITAYTEGAASARPEARIAAIREAISIATGVRQDADARIRGLELELADASARR